MLALDDSARIAEHAASIGLLDPRPSRGRPAAVAAARGAATG